LELLADAPAWVATITPAEVLSQIASPFAADPLSRQINLEAPGW
jgi:hypothetical protein